MPKKSHALRSIFYSISLNMELWVRWSGKVGKQRLMERHTLSLLQDIPLKAPGGRESSITS